MAKNITFNTDARAKLAKGVNTLADAVTVTIARCPENDGWRSITIERGEPL